MRLQSRIDHLLRQRIGSVAARESRAAAERELTQLTRTGGKAAAERAIADLRVDGRALEVIEPHGRFARWRRRRRGSRAMNV